MTSDSNWKKYFNMTKGANPRPTLVSSMKYVKNKDEALELGAGALNDVRYLLGPTTDFKHITALDKVSVPREVLSHFPKDKLSYVVCKFEDFEFPQNKYDLVNAQYSLPFISRIAFPKVLNSILESLKPGGVMVGQFFGIRDEWNNKESDITFHSIEEAKVLLEKLKIVSLKEEEAERKTALGVIKHWHVIHFTAIKNGV
jgi:SAM-dependent methyltransferase